jgi:hypothetical protein
MKNIIDFAQKEDLFDLFHSAYKAGLEGAVFKLYTEDSSIGGSLIDNLIESRKLENYKLASSFYGYNFKKSKPSNRHFYTVAKATFEQKDSSSTRQLCNAIIENVIISDQIRLFYLHQGNYPSLAMKKYTQDIIDILYDIVADTTTNNYWNTDGFAFAILAFTESETAKFKETSIAYKDYYNRNKLDSEFIKKIEKGEKEIFDSFMENLVFKKIDVATNYKDILSIKQIELVAASIEFIKS